MMCGRATSDPVVKYYDQTLAVTSSDDIAWFVNQAKTSGGRVLDLACGTGRIAIPLAVAGLEVTAIDTSSGMLQVFRDKLSSQPMAIQSRIKINQVKMHSFDVPESFSTVVCCDAFFHNLTVDHQLSCLHCIESHLIPGGLFVFNIPNPTIGFLSHAASSEGKIFKKRNEYPLEDTNDTILIEQAQDANLSEQTITTSLRFKRFDAKHNLIETEESSWTTRFTFRYEAVHLLYRCGFEVESLTGNYRGAPVTENSQLVFIAKKCKNYAEQEATRDTDSAALHQRM